MKRITLALVVLVGVAGTTHATLVLPDGSGDYPTIQAAIDATPYGATILLGDGVFTGPGNRDLQIEYTLLASQSGDPEACILDAGGFDLGAATDGLWCTGIGIRNAGPVTNTLHPGPFRFENCVIEGGHGLVVSNWAALTDCVVRGNSGALVISAASCSATGCLFESNFSPIASAYYPTLENCTFTNNQPPSGYSLVGVAVNEADYGSGSFTNCRFAGNDAVSLVHFSRGTEYHVVTGCEFAFNPGSCLWFESGFSGQPIATISGCTFVANGAEGGADIVQEESQGGVSVERCIFSLRQGGDVVQPALGDYELTFTDCDLYGNVGGDWVGVLADQYGVGCNMSENPQFCDWAGGDFSLYDTSPCLPANNTCAVQMGAEGQGCEGVTAVDDTPSPAALLTAHPNPFNPKTRLSFSLPAAADVRLAVYALDGRRVATVLDGQRLAAGPHALDWEARDASGHPLASGVYLLALEAGGHRESMKLTLLR